MSVHSIANYIIIKYGVNHIFARSLASRHVNDLKTEKDIDKLMYQFNLNKPKPFVKWAGGKRQLLKQFKELGLYPPEDFDPKTNTYFEPFVGGGAVFFDLLPNKAVLSDINSELITTYLVIQKDVESLIKSLKKHKNAEEYFLKMRAKDPSRMSDIEVASRFIYLNKTAFNGLYRVNKKGEFNVPFGRYKNPKIVDEENLRNVSKYLQGVEIKLQDYKQTIKKAKKGDFIYFDPPYAPLSPTSSFTSYTKNGFDAQQQIELRDIFYELHEKGCFVMLSNSNSNFINEIYRELTRKDKKIKIHKVSANRMINSKADGRGKIKEVLVINY